MTSEYKVQIGSGKDQRTHDVLVEPQADGRFRVVISGPEGPLSDEIVDARRVERGERADGLQDAPASAASWSLRTDAGATSDADAASAQAAQRVIDIDGTLPDLKVTVSGGDAIVIKLQDARAAALSAGAQGGAGGATSGELRAAMPGKVVKLLVQAGDTVKAGQGLLVIEAMKMENELRAAGAGKVASIAVREGQTVDGGQLLISITPA